MTLLAIDAASGIRPGKPYAPTGGDTAGETAQIFYHVHLVHQRAEAELRVPTTIIDITDTAVLKANAMNRFTSQHYGEDSPLHRKLGEGMDGGTYRSTLAYAEAFLAQPGGLRVPRSATTAAS